MKIDGNNTRKLNNSENRARQLDIGGNSNIQGSNKYNKQERFLLNLFTYQTFGWNSDF